MKKLLVRTRKFPTITETFIANQINTLSDLGVEITISCEDEDKEIKQHQIIKEIYKKAEVFTGPLKQFNLDSFDALHIHYGPTFMRSQKELNTKTPIIVSFHGYDASRTIQTERAKYYQSMFEKIKWATVPSEEMKNRLTLYGYPSEKIRILRYGLDLNKFKPQGEKYEKLTFLTIARFTEKKGIQDSLEAFQLLRGRENLQYNVIGTGHLALELKFKIKHFALKNENRINFLGELTQEEVLKEIQKSHVFVLTSKTASSGDMEGLPVSLIEASACELPCVSTKHAGIEELLKNEFSAFLAPEGDIKKIALFMFTLSDNKQLREEFGRNARIRTKALFNKEKTIKDLYRLLFDEEYQQ